MAKTNSTPVPTPKSFPQDRASELALKLEALLFQTYGDSGEAFRNTHETLQDCYMWACFGIAAELRALINGESSEVLHG